jgi:MFS family permease
MSAIVILGSVLGNFFSGEIANLIGRANSCICGSLMLFFAQSMISISYDFQSLSMLRFITSFLIGFFGPIAITLLTEIIPCYIRGRFVVFLGLGFIAG